MFASGTEAVRKRTHPPKGGRQASVYIDRTERVSPCDVDAECEVEISLVDLHLCTFLGEQLHERADVGANHAAVRADIGAARPRDANGHTSGRCHPQGT